MSTLKEELISRLNSITDVSVERYKNSELLCVNHKNKEVAHFQTESDCELDIRLSPTIIKQQKLTVPEGSKSHPNRAKNFRWIVQEFKQPQDLDRMVGLVKLAIELR